MAEAAGLVLAVIPLVISALEHYAQGVSTVTKWWSYKRELNSLVRVLDAEYARFLGTCEKLLYGLVSPAELKALIEHPGGPLWKNKVLDQKLKIRLQRSYSSYSRSIEDMVEAVKDLETKLEIGPNGEPQWGNYHTCKHEFKRVKFSLSRKGYEESMKRIEKNNDLLANLTEQNMELEPARKRRRRGGPHFRSIQEHARNLYSVINKGWTCNCAEPHQANLRLDDRLKDMEINDTNKSLDNGPGNLSVQFKVMFSVNTVSLSSETAGIWQETEIRVLNENEVQVLDSNVCMQPETMEDQQYSETRQSNNTRQSTSSESQEISMLSTLSIYATNPQSPTTSTLRKALSRKSAKYANPSLCDDTTSGYDPKITKASGFLKPIKKGVKFVEFHAPKDFEQSKSLSKTKHADLVKIEDLCLTMHQCMENMKYDHRCLGYLAHEARYRLGVYLPPLSQVSHGKQNITSLAQLLSSKQDGHNQFLPTTGDLSLCRGDRLNLALTVASSVLQLYKTPWLRDYWNKNDIMISGDRITNVREQVYVSRSFPAVTSEGSQSMKKFPVRNVTLFALSIVLIEICLGQSLESLRSPEDPLDPEGRPGVLTDWSTASRMEDAVYREAGTRYGDAVRRCLYCDFDQRDPNLEDDSFRQAVYDGVVAPLEDDVKDFFQL
ncbi:hypothetical protein MMC17_004991 [Xylographa soralifera]|nr:hypothetical protein [Xylographa soralifera]